MSLPGYPAEVCGLASGEGWGADFRWGSGRRAGDVRPDLSRYALSLPRRTRELRQASHSATTCGARPPDRVLDEEVDRMRTMRALVPTVAAALAVGGHVDAEATHAERVVGHGQIRFQGAGPERWAFRFRRERRAVFALRDVVAARLDRLVGLVLDFECVHRYEGAWGANTGNGYRGGLQFGSAEWTRYGGRYAASADVATPAEQIAAAITYEGVAGFYPWPNTARACGLLP